MPCIIDEFKIVNKLLNLQKNNEQIDVDTYQIIIFFTSKNYWTPNYNLRV